MDNLKNLFCGSVLGLGLAGCAATAAPTSEHVCNVSGQFASISAADGRGVLLMANVDHKAGNTLQASHIWEHSGGAADHNGVTMLPQLPKAGDSLKITIDPKGNMASCALTGSLGQTRTVFTPGTLTR